MWFSNPALDALLQADGVTDMVINGPDSIWVDRGRGMERVEVAHSGLSTPADVRALALTLARYSKTRLDDACPVVDARLESSSGIKDVRLHAVLAPVADTAAGAYISLRTLAAKNFSLDALAENGMCTPGQCARLKQSVLNSENVVISGATSSGKTTLMAALLSYAPPSRRIIAVEEARELSAQLHPGLLALSARAANSEGAGAVGLAALLKATLRMRPDQIVLGECRGEEVREFLLALSAGYAGSLTTLHAHSAEDVLARLEMLGFAAGMPSALVRAQAQSHIDLVVHLENVGGVRRVAQIYEMPRPE